MKAGFKAFIYPHPTMKIEYIVADGACRWSRGKLIEKVNGCDFDVISTLLRGLKFRNCNSNCHNQVQREASLREGGWSKASDSIWFCRRFRRLLQHNQFLRMIGDVLGDVVGDAVGDVVVGLWVCCDQF